MTRRHAALLALACLALLPSATAHASRTQESQFQDDNRLIYAEPDAQARTLDELQGLGVDRIRVTVVWKALAPDIDSQTKPNFDASDPNAYESGKWANYDRLVQRAAERGIKVNFNPTAPAPNWATGNPARTDIDETYDPNPSEYAKFVAALGTRYSGTFTPPGASAPLPRVDYWSIWNEPNQSGWLTPQWSVDPRDPKKWVEAAPKIYRSLVDAGWIALQQTGHGTDTFLAGETAPKGLRFNRGETRQMDALRFLRGLYCLDDNFQFYRGTSAELRGCPVSNPATTFVQDHPGLFKYTGYAHHPYELIASPATKPTWKDWATIANLSTLSSNLRKIFQRYGQPLPAGAKKDVPLYLTEFGYQTNPPDRFAVSLAKQAAYNSQAEYMTWKNPAVKTLSQFLLEDDAAPAGTAPGDDATFQSGLTFRGGKLKPAYTAYQMPFYIPSRKVRKGKQLRVWGGARISQKSKRVTIQVQTRATRSTKWVTARRAKTDGKKGYVWTTFRARRSGAVRLLWVDAKGRPHTSRSISVSVR